MLFISSQNPPALLRIAVEQGIKDGSQMDYSAKNNDTTDFTVIYLLLYTPYSCLILS